VRRWPSVAVALGILALVAAGAWWLWPVPAAEAPATRAALPTPTPPVARPVPSRPVLAPPSAPPPEAAPASPYLAAHEAVAQALGYVAITCWVGTAWDTEDLVGAYHQKIKHGWYSNVEESLAGRHGVERQWYDPDRGEPGQFETLFEVSWTASAPGESVPCTVHTLSYADVRVHVADQDGRPVAGATVYGCGSHAETDAQGEGVLEQVFAGERCSLSASAFPAEGERCSGTLAAGPFVADSGVDLDMAVTCGSLFDAYSREEPDPEPASAPSGLVALSTEDELARFRVLAGQDLGEDGDRLIDALIIHREAMLALAAKQEEQMRRSDAILQQMSAAKTPAEVEAAMEALRGLTDEVRDGAP
jgi:hypothetical protein